MRMFPVLLVWLCLVSSNASAADHRPSINAPQGHAPGAKSGLVLSALTSTQVANLVTLAKVWGFLKYHHPLVTAGLRNWDYELFKILPEVLAAPNPNSADDKLVEWINELGPIEDCKSCASASDGVLDEKPPIQWIYNNATISEALSKSLQSIYANRTGKQFFVSVLKAGNVSFDHEPAYPQIAFPDSGYQLLALFRWWNIIQYWAPNRDRANQDWTSVLAEFIPKFALAENGEAYQLVLFELVARANDGHAFVSGPFHVQPPIGECAVPIVLRPVEGRPVVFRAEAGDATFRPGDVIDAIDGQPVTSLMKRWEQYYSASNDVARTRDIVTSIARGACGVTSVSITRNGEHRELAATRIKFIPPFGHELQGDAFRMLSPDVAYIKLSIARVNDVAGYFEAAKSTKAIILDLRGYPREALQWELGKYLATEPTRFASITFPNIATPGETHFGASSAEMIPKIEPGTSTYRGRALVLVDETTQSAAEFAAMALRALPSTKIVGSTTAGADGNVSQIPMPGGSGTFITGLGVYYPDHRATQRVGIVPDVIATPTIKGIAAGQNEVLDVALKLLHSQH